MSSKEFSKTIGDVQKIGSTYYHEEHEENEVFSSCSSCASWFKIGLN